ncbi:PIR Superfamily Protein [Plasmodium ovale curtisi]|uniref:PIR Superfamily Protein n=1 Tax=Plasmodium ovale curtisi TaxID=864141 RepID=A0A1A8XF53_PLAOA|nr:PIR Superfamily Protein [Plasmodium ovale curtisi]
MLSESEYTRYSRKELFSERFYQERDIDTLNLSNYSKQCDVTVAIQYKQYVNEICEKVLKFLEKSEKWEKKESGYDECILLNYWVYDLLDKYFNHDTTQMNIAFSGLQNVWGHLIDDRRYAHYYHKCKPLFNDIINYNDWKQRKELYEYYVDYSTLYGLAKNYDKECEYYEKIEAKKSLYDHFGDSCLNNKYDCPELYKKCENYNPDKVLSDLPCHSIIPAKRAALKATSAHNPSGKEQGIGDHGTISALPGLGSGFSTENTQENTDIGKKVGHSVLGVAPILLTATALYRYTPVGSWFRKLGGYNESGIRDMDEFSSYTQESADMLSDNSTNYISYQPI